MPLLLPPTLMPPKAEDYPAHLDPKAIDAKRDAADIGESFWVSMAPADATYECYSVVNVDAPRFWDVLERLVARIPEPFAILIGEREAEPYKGPYVSRAQLMPILRLFRVELANDPFLEWGVIHQTHARTEEVFVAHAKYLRVWTSDADDFRQELASLRIPELEKLVTIDAFPLMSLALPSVMPGALHASETVANIIEKLEDIDDD